MARCPRRLLGGHALYFGIEHRVDIAASEDDRAETMRELQVCHSGRREDGGDATAAGNNPPKADLNAPACPAASLVAANGLYARLARLQFEGI